LLIWPPLQRTLKNGIVQLLTYSTDQ